MNDKVLFMFNVDYIYNFFKIRTNDIQEASERLLEIIKELAEIKLYGDIIIVEERDYNGIIHKNPYLVCIYEGE